jgi:hypothetical protein
LEGLKEILIKGKVIIGVPKNIVRIIAVELKLKMMI